MPNADMNPELDSKTLSRYSADVIYQLDLKTKQFTAISPSVKELLGYSPEEILSHTIQDALTEKSYSIHRERMKDVLKKNDFAPTIIEAEVVHKEGHTVTVEVNENFILSRRGNPLEIVGVARDITDRKKNELALAYRINFERVIYTTSSNLVGATGDKMDEEINRALKTIATFTHTDRAYVFEFREGLEIIDNTYEWCAEETETQIRNLKNIHVGTELPWFSRMLRNREILNVPVVSKLPPEAHRERRHFEAQNIQSLIAVPMATGDRLIGFLGFDSVRHPRTWTNDDQLLLRWVGNNLANALDRKYREKRLKESQKQLELAIRGTQAGIWDWHVQTGQAAFNERWAEIIGYTLDELAPIGIRTWRDHCHPDDLAKSDAEIEKHAAGETDKYAIEARMRHKNGDWIWVSDRGKIVQWDASGNPLRMVGTHIDITEKKRYEAVIQAERNIAATFSHPGTFNERLALCLTQIIHETAMDSGGLYRVDEKDGSLVLVVHEGLSKEFIRSTGYFPANSLNARLVRGSGPVFTLYEDFAPDKKALIAMEGLKAMAIIPVHFQGRTLACLNLASHSMFHIEENTRFLLNKISTYLGSFIAQEIMEEKNRQVRRDFDTLINTVQDMIFILDFDGNILFCNSTVDKKLGYDTGRDLVGKNVLCLHPSDCHGEVESVLTRMMTEETKICTIPLVTKDGRLIPVETLVEFGRWENQNVIFGISRDITERLKMEQQEKQIAKAQSLKLMAGAIAHNFNNSLGVVVGNLELAMDSSPRKDNSSYYISQAFEAANKAAELSKLMLTYIGQANPVVQPECMDLAKACRNILARLTKKSVPGILFEMDFPDAGPVITGSETQLYQALNQLVTNSIESFKDGKGTISLSLMPIPAKDIPNKRFPPDFHPKENTYACLEVKDNGSGISETHVEYIFDPFFSTKFTGRGLGLPVVLGIMHEFGGAVAIQSRLYKGSVFKLFFPLHTDTPMPKEVE